MTPEQIAEVLHGQVLAGRQLHEKQRAAIGELLAPLIRDREADAWDAAIGITPRRSPNGYGTGPILTPNPYRKAES